MKGAENFPPQKKGKKRGNFPWNLGKLLLLLFFFSPSGEIHPKKTIIATKIK